MNPQKRLPLFRRLAALAALCVFPISGQNFIVTSQAQNISALAKKYDFTVVHTLDAANSVHLVTPDDPYAAVVLGLVAPTDPAVKSVELDQPTHVTESEATSKAAVAHTTDPLNAGSAAPVNYYGDQVRSGYAAQPMATLLNLPAVHSQYTLGGGVVAVIDTGIDPAHPALQRWIVPGYDFINNRPGVPNEMADVSQSTVGLLDRWASQVPVLLNQSTVGLLDQSTVGLLDGDKMPEAFGHGTMTSGLVHLVAPSAHIMPLKAFHADGTGAISDIVRAIYYAADHGAKVINMSFSAKVPSQSLTDAIHYATSKGLICVASAGNDAGRVIVYPAASPGSIGVASTNSKDRRSVFSNYGVASAHMGAPGEALITSYPAGHYAGVWGTSFSTALVSGAAALLTQLHPKASSSDLRDAFSNGKHLDDQGIGDARLDPLESIVKWGTDN
jgi:subtilisin family serine protease